jgi:hypothetical protein
LALSGQSFPNGEAASHTTAKIGWLIVSWVKRPGNKNKKQKRNGRKYAGFGSRSHLGN